jgi:DNA polymerase III epsilon subunit-like protein
MAKWDDSEFSRPEELQKHRLVPPLMIGYDLETTGLDTSEHQPISYGISVYRNGKISPTEQHHFLVKPTCAIDPKAEAVHGWSKQKLEDSYNGHIVTDSNGTQYHPALDARVGIRKAAHILNHYIKQGGIVIGANHKKFDFDMTDKAYAKLHHGLPLISTGLDLNRVRSIDVIAHDRVIDPEKPDGSNKRSRALTKLCQHYGVPEGGHRALDDARAACDVLLSQVNYNQERSR